MVTPTDHDYVVGTDGRRRPSRKMTHEEVERRRDVVAALALDGYRRDAIAEAIGVSSTTVTKDLAVRSVSTRAVRSDDIPPERAYWRDWEPRPKLRSKRRRRPTPVPPKERYPDYLSSRVLDHLDLFHGDFVDRDYANQLAWMIDEAQTDGDRGAEWLAEKRQLIEHVLDEVGRFRRIILDDYYRYQCRATDEGRESMRKVTLRSVQ